MVGCTKTVQPPDDMLSVLPPTTDEVQPVVVPSDHVTEQSAELLSVTHKVHELLASVLSASLLATQSPDVQYYMLNERASQLSTEVPISAVYSDSENPLLLVPVCSTNDVASPVNTTGIGDEGRKQHAFLGQFQPCNVVSEKQHSLLTVE